MSRYIVHIAAADGGFDYPQRLYAVDNNGVAWMMDEPRSNASWHQLPELPPIKSRRPLIPTYEEVAGEGTDE